MNEQNKKEAPAVAEASTCNTVELRRDIDRALLRNRPTEAQFDEMISHIKRWFSFRNQ